MVNMETLEGELEGLVLIKKT